MNNAERVISLAVKPAFEVKLELYRNLWGVTGPRVAALDRVIAAGYDGVEAVLFTADAARELREALAARPALRFKAVAWTKGRSVADHLESFHAQWRELAALNPSSISVIGGFDGWNETESAQYFESMLKVEAAIGLPMAHETHRNTALFHPAVTKRVLDRFPELKLVCDFSHWVLCCERMIHEYADVIRQCGRQAVHLHVRVGSEQTAQVSDLRAPEFAPYREAFESWWEIVWEEQARRGLAVTSLCPELGPPPYQQTLPQTGELVGDLWEMCEWQKQRQLERFQTWSRQRKAGPG